VTVYNHFPDLDALLPVCSAHWLAQHPLPDLSAAFAEPDPEDRLRAVLAGFYGYYRENEAMQTRVQGERATVRELESWMARSADVAMAELAGVLAAGFARVDARALVAVALDFWTWRRLAREGLDDAAAAALMAGAVASG